MSQPESWFDHRKFVSPGCCPAAEQNCSVYLGLPESWYDGDVETPPKWFVLGYSEYTWKIEKPVVAKFCPFCGSQLPEVEKANVNEPICTCTDGGYYCDTCEERLHCCKCLPPEFAWQPVRR